MFPISKRSWFIIAGIVGAYAFISAAMFAMRVYVESSNGASITPEKIQSWMKLSRAASAANTTDHAAIRTC